LECDETTKAQEPDPKGEKEAVDSINNLRGSIDRCS